ncbi:MAG: hypothetical protein WCL39_07920 [Armatimonadota bacterium]
MPSRFFVDHSSKGSPPSTVVIQSQNRKPFGLSLKHIGLTDVEVNLAPANDRRDTWVASLTAKAGLPPGCYSFSIVLMSTDTGTPELTIPANVLVGSAQLVKIPEHHAPPLPLE